MIIRQKDPVNFEFPFHRLDSFLVPQELFYIRSHFEAPELNADSYELRVDGAVEKSYVLSYKELRAMPAETRTATVECAGNSRVFLVPAAEGAQWELGAVGNAAWTGVPLRSLLEQAGLAKNACEVVFEGADRGMPKEKPMPPEPIAYARSLPCEKALGPEVLVAYQMNGEDLSRDHGHPVRLVVPGHYGMASVKWLTAIRVLTEPFQGYWQTSDYAYWGQEGGHPVRRPLGSMCLKSQIARPAMYEVIAGGSDYTVAGAAWSGGASVAEVEVSTDGGHHWATAQFLDEAEPYAWRRWKFAWRVPDEKGRTTLLARAKDVDGACQAQEHDANYGPYVIDHCLPIEVVID